jgi:hypothetical protein
MKAKVEYEFQKQTELDAVSSRGQVLVLTRSFSLEVDHTEP